MKLLDLFCGAGGSAMGYYRAGFEVEGVDIKPQKNYPFKFYQDDALEFLEKHGKEYDVIHASPPCQKFTSMKTMWNHKKNHPDLLTPVREILITLNKPYVIENVPGSMINAILLCGSMFGLGVNNYQLKRHRLFECNVLFPMYPKCNHRKKSIIGIYGDHARCRRRNDKTGERGIDFPDKDKINLASKAMGIDWMNWKELSQAIPPAYTKWIGERIIEQMT